jgi:hypothetical protein
MLNCIIKETRTPFVICTLPGGGISLISPFVAVVEETLVRDDGQQMALVQSKHVHTYRRCHTHNFTLQKEQQPGHFNVEQINTQLHVEY